MRILPWKSTQPVSSTYRDGNVVQISGPNGLYTIIYGVHILATNPELIPHNTDAVVLETGAVQWTQDPEKALDYLQQHVQYQELFRRFEQDHISVLFADVNYKTFPLLIPLLDMVLLEAEINLGTRLLKKSYRTMRKKKKSAGDLAKITAGVVGGLWLTSSILSELGRVGSMLIGIGQKETAQFQKLSSELHPELFILIKKIRDTVIGYKMQQYALSSHHNSVAAVMGGAHTGLETQLELNERIKINYLERLKPILRVLVVPESLSQMAQLEFKRGQWKLTKIHEFPELKNIIFS